MIVGLGTDLVAVARIAAAHLRHGQRFLDKVYDCAEVDYCLAAREPGERLAARWAAKEACMKALGTGWARGVSFAQIALLPDPDGGAPRLRLTGAALTRAHALGADRWWCSVSHSDGFAVATVILER
ncbi:MAG: holo-ACP synthase [Planctomycetes bacterium]|nr:holo-ACP synthase [Planctomycetota bacterium]